MVITAVKYVLIIMVAVIDHNDDKFSFQKFVMAQNMMRNVVEKC